MITSMLECLYNINFLLYENYWHYQCCDDDDDDDGQNQKLVYLKTSWVFLGQAKFWRQEKIKNSVSENMKRTGTE